MRKNSVAKAGNQSGASFGLSRREFLAGLGGSMAASFLPNSRRGIFGSSWFSFLERWNGLDEVPACAALLYPPVDLSYFETPIGHRA
jgi:hypothetical protein